MIIATFVLMFGGLLSFVACFAASSQAGRRLVDFQFQNHHDTWVHDGRPAGGKLTRSELSFFGSGLAAILAFQSWAMRRPEWLPSDSDGEQFRVAMIRWGFYSLIGLAVAVAAGFLFFRGLIRAA